ncbi:response regulator [Brevibacillus choshinensis]|uniref:response regulator transcription factor n=1 Tax=Brevibacillus choshinensis TaxID=54911 RepID=UPI002E1AE4CE|nr:response regulator [Brevibacillus choshinensis]MED4582315.1 response regulator [Brevibacillus choshinensis]MED4780984.1 response regulator [Brevibacillus choshinensis]
MNHPCRAIIVDDEDWIREGLCEEIGWERLGINLAASFSEGTHAITYVLEHRVEIILTDIRMTQMTGLEMLAMLREHAADDPSLNAIKVIFLSGYGDFKYAQEALRLGAFDYLLKPSEVEDIERVLAKAKQQWEQDVQLQEMVQKTSASADTESKRSWRGDGVKEEPSSYLVKKAQSIIRERYAEDLQLTKLAGEVFVSPNYLSRLIRQETGFSFVEYLSGVRLQHAIVLLMSSHLKIYEIGEKVGYPNPRYFSDWFQKQTGFSPVEYRDRHQPK